MEMLKSLKNNESCYELFIPVLKSYFQQKCEVFQGRQIKEKFENWQKLTDDTEILETVNGATFKSNLSLFCNKLSLVPHKNFQLQEERFVQAEIDKLKRSKE